MALILLAGTSGYSYKEWKGSFYPEDLAAPRMLAFYAERFSTVEINNTFYRMPNAATLQKWCSQVPENFVFSLKAPQQITHIKRLKETADAVAHFYKVAEGLGTHRGPMLFQLPPFLKKDVPRLKEFLQSLPQGQPVAVEFRHESWHDDAVYAALKAHNAALCLADVDEAKDSTPREITANWGYVRLRRTDYTPQQLHIWNAWMQAQSWDKAYVYLKHEDGGKGPAWATELIKIATT